MSSIRRHPLGAFYVFTLAFSWGYWIPLALTGGEGSHFPGLLGPMLAAFVVSGACTGSAGVGDLLRRMARWRVPLRWYAPSGLLLTLGMLAVAADSWLSGEPLGLDRLGSMPGVPDVGWLGVFAVVLLVNGYGEETGWRGFAWPALRQRHARGTAALVLAAPWAIWHLPTFWLDTGMRTLSPYVIPGWLIGLVAGAVVLGWMYDQARQSVLIVALFHAALNMVSATERTEGLVAALVSVSIIGAAVVILRHDGGQRDDERSGATAAHPRLDEDVVPQPH
jgi:membrane protease YdiL (CAAX protease family)